MIRVKNSKIHWNYYMALENDLERLSRYIEFNEDNFPTYSIELAHLLLASSSEVDVVMKELCKLVAPQKMTGKIDINKYRTIIKEDLPELIDEPIYIHRYGIDVNPWVNWNGDENPNWWKSHNNVKHKRSTHFKEASLQHTLNSVGALLITNYYYYKLLFETEQGSELSPKAVTGKLQHKSPFVGLRDEYYYDNIVT